MVENVAGKMREAGVRPGTVCAFSMPTSCESIIYFYALWWIGAVAAPINPAFSEDEFEEAVKLSGAKILVSPYVKEDSDILSQKCEKVSEKLNLIEWHIHRTMNEGVVLETHSRLMGSGAAWAGGAGDFKPDPDGIAVHIASSVGTLSISHFAMCEAAKSFVSTYDLAVNMSTMLAPPLHDIHGILILIATFYSGGHIVLPGYSGFQPDKFWEYAKKHNITWVSASADQILDLYEENEKSKSAGEQQLLTFVRSSGGTCIAAELIDKVEKSLKTPVYESYGTAEACGFASANREGMTRAGTVGKAVNGVEIAIFDIDTKEMCPEGVVGEIAVSGTHVVNSYLDSHSAKECTFTTEPNDPEGTMKDWFATGDRGTLDNDGFVTVHGNSRTLRAEEIALQEERRLEEAKAAAVAKEAADRLAAEQAAAALVEEERKKEEERLAEERRLEAEEAEKLMAAEEAAAAEDAAKKEEHERSMAERSAALVRAGVENPEELDDETANAILARLEAIEANHRRLQMDVEGRNAAELEEMRRRVAEAEADAERAARSGMGENGKVVDVRMEELEAAVMAAAASAESSAYNTREAVKAAREVADAAYGSNQSQPVEVKASTGDQGALTKTVRVPLDDVESAMRKHPAVEEAKAFGRKDKRFGAEVFCAIVPKHGARVSEPWLKLHAQSVLPAPMVPKKFYYMVKMPEGITRRELAESALLKDLSSFSGFSDVKHVKGPQWKQKTKHRVGT